MSGEPGPDLEREGVEAFARLAGAVDGLRRELGGLSRDLAARVGDAGRAADAARLAAGSAEAAAEGQARILAAWLGGAALAGVLAAGGAGYLLGRSVGRDLGRAEAYAQVADEKAAASWAGTDRGRLALALERAGSLADLAGCARPGWQISRQGGRRVCFPRPAKDGSLHGWALP